jgi:hypothetical protein
MDLFMFNLSFLSGCDLVIFHRLYVYLIARVITGGPSFSKQVKPQNSENKTLDLYAHS